MSTFDHILNLASTYGAARGHEGKGSAEPGEAQAAMAELVAAVRKLEAEHRALLDDQERLAAILALEPAAWAVYWGIEKKQKNSVHFERITALAVAGEIKSFPSEVRPLHALPEQKN